MYESIQEREVYLPEGLKWTCAHTGKSYKGGQTVNYDAPLDIIPIFIKSGSNLTFKV